MADVEFSLGKRKNDKAPFAIIYGPSGVGKTTLAASSPDAVFLPTEDGAGELELNTRQDGPFRDLGSFMSALRYIYKNPEGIRSLVIDSLDHLEPLVWDAVCEKNGWTSIEEPGYGKGYIESDAAWREIIGALLKIRDNKGIAIIGIAHDIVRTVNDPTVDTYDAHELKLHKRAVALWKENSDLIGLLKNRVIVDSKTGKGKGGTTPTLFVRPSAAFTAKTRFVDMPATMSIDLDKGWEEVMQYIPFYKNNA